MANRAKRIEKELTFLKIESQFRGRFKKEKVKRKEGLKPTLMLLVNAISKNDFEQVDLKSMFGEFLLKIKKIKVLDKQSFQNFCQILQYPKPIFHHISTYEIIINLFFELEIHRNIDTWQKPKSKDEVVVFKSLCYHLFVKYKIPGCLDVLLEKIYNTKNHDIEKELLFHMIKGNGLHHFYKLPFKINSKVNYHFFNAPRQLNMVKAIWWAVARTKQVPYSLALKIVHEFDKVTKEMVWFEWMDELIFFLNRFKDISQNDLKKVMEFFIAQKRRNVNVHIPGIEERVRVASLYPTFQLKGRSVASVLRFCDEWKNYIDLIKAIGTGGDFKISNVQPFRVQNGKMMVVIKQIKNVKSLIREGKTMNHCVATYAGDCASGESSIWTMKLYLPGKKVKKALTIEVLENKKTINEALGRFNREASTLEKKWIEAWAEREGLQCSYS